MYSTILLCFIVIGLLLFILTDKKCISFMTNKNKTLVYYTNPNCGFCKKFDPVWNELIKKNKDLSVSFRKIDCSKDPNLCRLASQQYNMRGTPHIVLLQNNIYKIFNGDTSLQNLQKFIK